MIPFIYAEIQILGIMDKHDGMQSPLPLCLCVKKYKKKMGGEKLTEKLTQIGLSRREQNWTAVASKSGQPV